MTDHKSKPPIHEEIRFVPWITVKGRRIYAKTYGKKAFPIKIRK